MLFYYLNKEPVMPIKKSAAKELRKAKKRYLHNKGVLSELKTLDKNFIQAVEEKNLEQAKKILKLLSSRLNKAAAKKIIHKNKARRKISRLRRRLNKAQ